MAKTFIYAVPIAYLISRHTYEALVCYTCHVRGCQLATLWKASSTRHGQTALIQEFYTTHNAQKPPPELCCALTTGHEHSTGLLAIHSAAEATSTYNTRNLFPRHRCITCFFSSTLRRSCTPSCEVRSQSVEDKSLIRWKSPR